MDIGRTTPGSTQETDDPAAAGLGDGAGDGAGDGDGGPSRVEEAQPRSTKERILDIALRLFTEQGFDATSLQEIADHLGFTKAALYYHFRSKDDILMALHLRMHQIGRERLDQLGEGPVTLERWESVLSSVIDEMLDQRSLFLLHERNQAVLERLHEKDHAAEHDDLQARLRQVLSDPAIPLRDRVRMSCSLGAVFGALFVGVDASASRAAEIVPLLREALHDLLAP